MDKVIEKVKAQIAYERQQQEYALEEKLTNHYMWLEGKLDGLKIALQFLLEAQNNTETMEGTWSDFQKEISK